MGLMDSLKFKFWDGLGTVTDLIQSWQPEGCKSEKDFEKSLFSHLQKELSDIRITKQYARGRIKADIVIAEELIIELKTNLKTTGQLQRLMGQLLIYKTAWPGKTIVILTGQTDADLRKELDRNIKAHFEDFNPFDPWRLDSSILIVQK